ncbi:hypothetical protein ES705_25645 [subsurface metagenome]
MRTSIIYPPDTYEILYNGIAIKCLICGLISYNLNDVKSKYCGHCHIFHEELYMNRNVPL